MYNLSLFFSFSSRMFEPSFSLFRHFVYLDLGRNLVPRSSHSLRLSRHFEYISILVGNFGHVILLCARVFSRTAAILKSEKTLGTRLHVPVKAIWGSTPPGSEPGPIVLAPTIEAPQIDKSGSFSV